MKHPRAHDLHTDLVGLKVHIENKTMDTMIGALDLFHANGRPNTTRKSNMHDVNKNASVPRTMFEPMNQTESWFRRNKPIFSGTSSQNFYGVAGRRLFGKSTCAPAVDQFLIYDSVSGLSYLVPLFGAFRKFRQCVQIHDVQICCGTFVSP
jgi:hypothetical protein